MQGAAASNSWTLVDWETPPGIRLERGGHSATVLGGSTIGIAGGRRGSAFYRDVLLFDTRSAKLSKPVTEFPRTLKARANHTATLIGNRIWFIGGGDDEEVFDDVLTLDITTWTWQRVEVHDPHKLLARTAHAAEVHPHLPSAILITGGYGAMGTGTYDMLNDVVLFDTQSCSTEQLVPRSSCVPRRSYHTMSVIGDRLYLCGGRTPDAARTNAQGQHVVLEGYDMLNVFDLKSNKWIAAAASGPAPSPRSSHRAVTFNNRIIIYGGSAASGSEAPKQLLADVHTLLVLPHGQLAWSTCDSPPSGDNMPQGRHAHTMSLVGDTLYVMFGYIYTGSGTSKSQRAYALDCWKLQLRAAPAGTLRSLQATTAARPAAAGEAGQRVPGHKRHTSPARAAAPAQAAPATAGSLLRAGAAAVAGNVGQGSDTAAWRTVKRQRSGGKDKPQKQQQDQQQQQQQQSAWHPQQPEQQQPRQQQQQQPSLTSAVVAMAAALGQVMVGSDRAASPLRAGSPLRDSFSGNAAYLQQEVDHLREQLQQNIKWGSSLEAEVRLLKQQLSEAKAEARQDKQLAEHRLQDQQMEAARQRTLAEQALVRQQRAQEEATIAQQDLSTAKQQLQKAEMEQDAGHQQLQVLNGEVKKLRARSTEADQEQRQLQLQVQQQQQQERRLQEQLSRERQLQQEEVAATRASIEQHRNELRRLNDTMADQKQKYDAALLQCQQEAAAQQQKLLDTSCRLQEVQKQLDEAVTAASDSKKQRDEAMQLQLTTCAQLNALSATHKALLLEKENLESELAKVREQQEQLKQELEQRRSAAGNMQAALQQLQAALQTALNASGQLMR